MDDGAAEVAGAVAEETITGPDRAMVEAIRATAAELFTAKGSAATSTREIALRVGIKQASLYYYFPNKQAILESLMLDTINEPLHVIALLERESCSPAVRLHAMATYDASQLAADRWNLGALYLLPEIRHLPTFAQFFALNERLRDRYRELCASARAAAGLPPDPARTKLPYRIVETATRMRVDGEEVDVELIADSVLAVLQLDRLNDADRAESAALARAVLDRVSRTT